MDSAGLAYPLASGNYRPELLSVLKRMNEDLSAAEHTCSVFLSGVLHMF